MRRAWDDVGAADCCASKPISEKENKFRIMAPKIGSVPWNKGKVLGPQSLELRIRKAKTMRMRWAGTEAGARRRAAGTTYAGIHQRLQLIEKGVCRAIELGLSPCSSSAVEWAVRHEAAIHKDGLLWFSEELGDYVALCRKCHRRYDNTGIKSWQKRKIHAQNLS